MICKVCRQGADMISAHPSPHTPLWITRAQLQHSLCPGPTHCDCQHKTDLQVEGKAVQR